MILLLAQAAQKAADEAPQPMSPRSYLREIGENFAEGSGIPPVVFVWMFGLLVAFLLIRWTIATFRKLRRRTRPVILYHAIGRELGLDASDRWWLYSIAKRAGLASPLTLLMSSTTLGHHVEREIDAAPKRRRRGIRLRFESIRARLFDDAPVPRGDAGNDQ